MDWPTITKNTSIEEIFEIHRRIWDDILTRFERTGELRKPETPYFCNCVFCQCRGTDCIHCFADWGLKKDGTPHDCLSSGIYRKFSIHRTLSKHQWLYRQSFREEIIADIKAIRDIKPREELTNGERKHAEGSGRVSE